MYNKQAPQLTHARSCTRQLLPRITYTREKFETENYYYQLFFNFDVVPCVCVYKQSVH